MIACPLCGHEQPLGLECEQCGKDLGLLDGLGPPPAGEEHLEGLETWERTGEVAAGTLEGLESTTYAPGEGSAEVAEASPPLEPGTVGAPDDVAVEPMADLILDRYQDDEPRVASGGPADAPTCRYCRHVQSQPGQRLCERCGMSLQRLGASPAVATSASREVVRVRCRSCGALTQTGERCSECGRPVEG